MYLLDGGGPLEDGCGGLRREASSPLGPGEHVAELNRMAAYAASHSSEWPICITPGDHPAVLLFGLPIQAGSFYEAPRVGDSRVGRPIHVAADLGVAPVLEYVRRVRRPRAA